MSKANEKYSKYMWIINEITKTKEIIADISMDQVDTSQITHLTAEVLNIRWYELLPFHRHLFLYKTPLLFIGEWTVSNQ